ncbi:MAG: hypothetical protein ACT4RN_13425 [Pseudonocardia sp.]
MNDVPHRRWDDDELLLADLTEAVRAAAPFTEAVARHGRGAFAWRTVDEDLLLAGLSFDSSLEHTSRSRGAEDPARLLVFTAEPLSVEVELQADRIVGQIVPPGEGEVVVESTDGTAVRAEADDLGFFVVPGRPVGPVRLRCETARTRLVTDWFQM